MRVSGGRCGRRARSASASGSKFAGARSWISDCGWCAHPTSPRHEQRKELQREPCQDCRTASPAATCLSSAPPLLKQLRALGVHESFGLSRIHFHAVEADPVRGDEVSSHENGNRKREQNGEPDEAQRQSERAKYLRAKHVNPESRGTTVRAGGFASCWSDHYRNFAPASRTRTQALSQCIDSCGDVPAGGRHCGMRAGARSRPGERGCARRCGPPIAGILLYAWSPASEKRDAMLRQGREAEPGRRGNEARAFQESLGGTPRIERGRGPEEAESGLTGETRMSCTRVSGGTRRTRSETRRVAHELRGVAGGAMQGQGGDDPRVARATRSLQQRRGPRWRPKAPKGLVRRPDDTPASAMRGV